MYKRNFDEISVAATGVTVTTTVSTSAGGTLPNTSNGTVPRFVRVAATQPVFVRLRTGATTAVTTDCLVLPGTPQIFAVGPFTHYAVIDNAVVSVVNITPLEDS